MATTIALNYPRSEPKTERLRKEADKKRAVDDDSPTLTVLERLASVFLGSE